MEKLIRFIALLPSTACIWVGISSFALLVIWLFVPSLKEVSALTMKANSAAALLFSACSLGLWIKHRTSTKPIYSILARGMALLALSIGLITIIEYLFQIRKGIDELLVTDFPNAESSLFPGRMSPIAAICFAFCGLALLLLGSAKKKVQKYWIPTLLLLVVFANFVVIVGYLYGVSSLYRFGPFIRIAWPTSTNFLILSLGVLFYRPISGLAARLSSPYLDGLLTRRLIPAAVLFPVFLGYFRIWGERHGYFPFELGTSLLVVVLVFLFTALITFIATSLFQVDTERRMLFSSEQTARKQAELERAKMYSIFDAAPAAIGILRGPHFIREFSNKFMKNKMYHGRDTVGIPLRQTLGNSPQAEQIIASLKTVYEKGEPYSDTEVRIAVDWRGTGKLEERFFNRYFQPMYGPDGSIDGVVTFMMDVTALIISREQERRAREGLEKSEAELARLASIVEYSNDAIISVDLSGIITSWNAAASKMFSYQPQEILGKPIDLLVPKEKEGETEDIQKRIQKGEVLINFESERIEKGNHRIWVSLTLSPLKDRAGSIIGVSKIVRDISERKAYEERLHQAVQARDEFISMASHELKSPVTGLRLSAQPFRRGIQKGDSKTLLPESANKLADQTMRQTERINRLIDDMLDVSRIQTGKLTLNPESVDLSQLITEMNDRLKPQILEATGSTPLLELPKYGLIGNWDRLRIEQVLTNLLTNALKYGKGKPIEVRAEQHEDKVRLSIKDYGGGISKENQERIFKRFERATTESGISGLGLGLFITRQIVKAHGGNIWVESEVDHGSTFIVELPIQGPALKDIEIRQAL